MLNLSNIVKSIINEDDGQRTRKLDYTVSQSKRKLANGGFLSQTYLNINGLEPTDALTLVKSFRAEPRKVDGRINPNAVYYGCKAEDPSAFLNGAMFNGMLKYLSGTGRYDMPPSDLIKTEVNQAKYDVVSPLAIKVQNEQYEDLFERVITSLNDPKTIELLQSISKIGFNINEKIYGHVMSAGNAMRTYAVKPDATFVATRKGWRAYNRILNSTPTPILLWSYNASSSDASKAETELGVKLIDIKDNPFKKQVFRIQASNGGGGFSRVAYFDVSDTMVIPQMEDLWTNKGGLVDNLRGVLNQIATEELGGIKTDTENLGIASDETKNKSFCEKMVNYLSGMKDMPPAAIVSLQKLNPTLEETVVQLLKTYYTSIFEREHDANIRNSRIVAGIVTTLTVEGLAETKRLQLLKTHEDNIRKYFKQRADYALIAAPVEKLVQSLKGLSEGVLNEETVTPEFIMNLFGVDPNSLSDDTNNNEIIREQFYTIFNKLNNAIK